MRDDRTRRERLLALGAGVLFAADLTLWHTSIEYIGAGLSTVVANSQVLWVGLLAWMLLGKKPRKAAFVVVPIALVGIALIGGLGRDDAYGENPMLGVIFALLAGISYSLFLLVYRASNKRMGPPAGPLLDTTAGGALTMLLISRFDGDFSFAFSLAIPRVAHRSRSGHPVIRLAADLRGAPPSSCSRHLDDVAPPTGIDGAVGPDHLH